MVDRYLLKTYVRLIRGDRMIRTDAPENLWWALEKEAICYDEEIEGMSAEEIAEKEALDRDMAIIKLFELLMGGDD